jgi:hypothetical protein
MTLTLTTRRFFDGERLHDDRSTAITIRDDRIVQVSEISGQGEPFADAHVLAEPKQHLMLIIRGGEIVMNRLAELAP